MVYFIKIKPTTHYLKEHINDVPWDKVVEIIFSTKNPRKKDDKFEIEKEGYYILFKIEDKILHVINAKNIGGWKNEMSKMQINFKESGG